MAKTEKLFSKVVMLLFMVMLVLGFVVPGLLQGNNVNDVTNQVEPRVCQSDSDCYLICDSAVAALCYRNLCSQNSCDEYAYFPLEDDPITYSFSIDLDGEMLGLWERSNPKDFFITFENEQVQLYSSGLNLANILDKIQVLVSDHCIRVDGRDYCNDGLSTLKYIVNGNESTAGARYIPKEGDIVELIYSN